jgi:hypothetical protein
VLGRSLRKLCIALNAVAEASAITVTRPAVCNHSQELQTLTERTATTQAAITAMTDLRRAATVNRFSIRFRNARKAVSTAIAITTSCN